MASDEESMFLSVAQDVKVTDSDFDYTAFFISDDQSNFLKQYLYGLVENILSPNQKYFLIKRELRNLDWKAISSSGMLQEKFIVSQISLDQLEYHNIISEYTENNPYLPIKFFHYLIPQLLCKYNNLTKKLDWENYLYPTISKDESSQSSSSFASITTRQITESIQQPFYEYYIDYINQDLNEFIEDTNKFFTDKYQMNTVHRYDFLENKAANSFNSEYNCSKYNPRIYNYLQICDKCNGKGTLNVTNQDESISIIDCDKCTGKKFINKLKPTKFSIRERYFAASDISYQYKVVQQDEQGRNIQVIKTQNRDLVSGSIRNVGITLNQLIQNQNIQLDFAKKYYDMNTICRYYKFTQQELWQNKDGLAIGEDAVQTNYNFQLLFKYNSFDTNDENFKNFFEYHENEILISELAIKNFQLYQKFEINETPYSKYKDEENQNLLQNVGVEINNVPWSIYKGFSAKKDNDLFKSYVNFLNWNSPSNENYYFLSVDLKTNFGCIKQKFPLLLNNIVENNDEDNDGIKDFIEQYSDNIIITNCDDEDKIAMISTLFLPSENRISESNNEKYPLYIYNNFLIDKNLIPNNYPLGWLYSKANINSSNDYFFQYYDRLNNIQVNCQKLYTDTPTQLVKYPDIFAYKDQQGYYLKLYVKKYNNYYIGMVQDSNSININFHTPQYLNSGINYCNKKISQHKNYYIVGTQKLLTTRYSVNPKALQPVKIYVKDIIAILENKCLAANKIYVENVESSSSYNSQSSI